MTSSLPPSSATWSKAKLGLVVALTMLATAITQRVLMTPTAPAATRPEMEVRQPEPPPLGPPDRRPTTDDGVVASRVLEARLNPLLAALADRAATSEMRICLLEQELRDARLALVAVEAGKRATFARDAFRTNTTGWGACFLDVKEVQRRTALRDAAASALGK